MTNSEAKLHALERYLRDAERVAVAFSGGTDSTFLLAFAHELPGVEAIAITVQSALMPSADVSYAKEFCDARDIPHIVLEVDPLSHEEVRTNPPDRCYHCKNLIMGEVARAAKEHDALPCDGTNADDLSDYRPGMRAVREQGIASPLAEAGLTKQEIREAARQRGLSNWDTPASACLASRIPYGTPLDENVLEKVERLEEALHAEGFAQARVRVHDNLARIEIPSSELTRMMEGDVRTRVIQAVRDAGFAYVTLDLEGYRMGSLNEEI